MRGQCCSRAGKLRWPYLTMNILLISGRLSGLHFLRIDFIMEIATNAVSVGPSLRGEDGETETGIRIRVIHSTDRSDGRTPWATFPSLSLGNLAGCHYVLIMPHRTHPRLTSPSDIALSLQMCQSSDLSGRLSTWQAPHSCGGPT